MATIKDVARVAGVSHGTVSNVLTGKMHVAPEKVKRVNDAIEELGYVPTAAARSLKTNRTMAIAVILPQVQDARYASIYSGIEGSLTDNGYTTFLLTSGEIPRLESDILSKTVQQRVDGILIATCQPHSIQEEYSRLNIHIPTVFIERDVGPEHNFIGFDNRTAVQEAVLDYLNQGYKDIALVCGPTAYSNEAACIDGYKEAFEQAGLEYEDNHILITANNKESGFRSAVELFQSSFIPEVVICTSEILRLGTTKALDFLEDYLSLEPIVICLEPDSWILPIKCNTARILQPARELGEQSVKILLENIQHPIFHTPNRIRLQNQFSKPRPSYPLSSTSRHRKVLRIAMLQSAASRALLSISKDFEHTHGYAIEIEQFDYDELYSQLSTPSGDIDYDLLQIDLPWMGDIISQGRLISLDSFLQADKKLIDRIVPGALESYALYEGSFYAIPFIFGTQLLFYRKDLFEDTNLQNLFFEEYRTDLTPPTNWNQFNAIAKFFNRSFNPASPVPYGTTLGGKDSSGAVCEVLPRIWGFHGDVFDKYGNITIDNEESIRGIQSYVESFRYAPAGSPDHWWNEQVEFFAEGEAAMMVLFVAHATEISDRHHLKVAGRVGYDMIPGGTPLLGGWSIGISSDSRDKEGAFRFMQWIANKENAIPHMILGGANPSIHLYQSSELRSIYPWLLKSLDSFHHSRKRQLPSEYYPGLKERQFEKILGREINAAIKSRQSPKEAAANVRNSLEQFRSSPPR